MLRAHQVMRGSRHHGCKMLGHDTRIKCCVARHNGRKDRNWEFSGCKVFSMLTWPESSAADTQFLAGKTQNGNTHPLKSVVAVRKSCSSRKRVRAVSGVGE